MRIGDLVPWERPWERPLGAPTVALGLLGCPLGSLEISFGSLGDPLGCLGVTPAHVWCAGCLSTCFGRAVGRRKGVFD